MHQGTIRNGTFAPRSHLSGSVLQKRPQELTQPRLCYSGEFTADFRRMRGRKRREPVEVRGSERGQLIDSFKDRWEDHSRLHAHGKNNNWSLGKERLETQKHLGSLREATSPPLSVPLQPCISLVHQSIRVTRPATQTSFFTVCPL